MKGLLTTLTSAIFILILTVTIVKNIQLKQNCTGYLKRAADANTVESASKELNTAINYLEDNNLTSGYTSVLWRTPNEDVGFWYNNIKNASLELAKVDSTTSALERSNILIKLRESVLDHGEKGDHVSVPDGLARYPNNTGWAILFALASICFGYACTSISVSVSGY
jgi:hypothetical protein